VVPWMFVDFDPDEQARFDAGDSDVRFV